MHCIHVTYAFSLTLALELIWNVELVLACASWYSAYLIMVGQAHLFLLDTNYVLRLLFFENPKS